MFYANLLIGVSSSMIFLILLAGYFLPYFSNVFAFTDINFVAAGDFSCPVTSTSNPQKTINNIKSRNAERVLGLGDYSYGDTVKCWIDTLDKSGLDLSRVKQNIGNHETDKSGKLSAFVNEYEPYPPSTTVQYYSFNYQRESGGPKIHVLVMATEQCWSVSCPQYKFVDNDLKVASQDSTIQWIIVDYHKVMYISPNACSSSSCVGSSSLRAAYNPLFDKYGVDIVLQGHVHNYERSKLIKYSGGSTPTIVQSSTTSYNKPSLRAPGEIFATVGIGGVNFHSFSGKSSFVAFQRSNSDGFGILDLLVTNDGKTLIGKYIPNGGSVRDQFTITKTLPSSLSTLGANTIPSAINQSVSTSENTAKPITLIAKGKSNGSLQYSIVTPPLHGELTGKRPSVVYIPSANYTGEDQFTFKVNNGRAESNLATINITVHEIGPSTSPSILENASKAQAENKQLKPLIENGKKIISNQTEPVHLLPDLTKPLITKRQAPSNESQPLQVQPDLTKPVGPRKQTEPLLNTTKSNKISILPKEKVLPIRPIANAGQQQIVGANSQVTLDASKSIDNDGTIVSYLWTQVKGPKVLLGHPDKIKSIFRAPDIDKDIVLVFRLVVRDNSGLIDSDTVGVTIPKTDELRQENNSARIQTETENPPPANGIKMRNST